MNAPVTTAVPLVQAQTSLRDVIAQVFRHRGLLLGCALLVGGLVAALVYLQPPSYTATATVLVERGKSPVMRTETTTLSVEINEAIETEIQLLTSRTVAEGVVDRLRLHERPRRPSRVRDTIEKARETLTGWGLLEPAERRESTVRGFLSTFKAKHPPLTWMITMAYSAEDPSDAAAILRTTLDVYFDRRRAVYLNDTASFFAKRVEQIDGQLIERRGGLARTTEVAERGRYPAIDLLRSVSRSLPDAAIDLLDRTMASVKFAANTATTDLKKLDEALASLLDKKEETLDLLGELKWFHKELNNKVSHVLTGQLDDETDINTLETAEAVADYLKDVLARLTKLAEDIKSHVDKTDIAAMIAHKTGIPIGKLGGQERERLMGMEAILQKRVVGQDHAIKSLSEAILEARSGLNKQGQPIGSFFLLGPTGTGKTEVAKSLAEFLFQTESAMIRFDMSEFKEEHSAALLYGAPPGYVGYEEGGVLVNKIRQQPYAIVLFDEIEKAHPSVFDIFLQILDEGKMHDRLGKEGDFSNAVILFTSNIGAETIIQSFAKDVIPKSNDLLEIMANHFRPEFLARLTEIVPFAPISEKNVVKIFEIHVKSLHKSLERQGITLEVTPEAKEKIALMGFTPRYGARPLTGMIRTQLRRPLSKMIIAGEISKGSHVKVSVVDGELKWEK